MRTLALVSAVLLLATAVSAAARPTADGARVAATEVGMTPLTDVQGRGAPARVQQVSLLCMDASFGSGTCPSPIEVCRDKCDEEYALDTLRCMAGAGGILLPQRAVCHFKAAQIHGQCHRDCSDLYG